MLCLSNEDVLCASNGATTYHGACCGGGVLSGDGLGDEDILQLLITDVVVVWNRDGVGRNRKR